MSIDLRDTETQFDRTIPAGVYGLQITVKPGGEGPGGFLRRAKNRRQLMLELECTIATGEHKERKVWDYITLALDESERGDALPIPADQLSKFHTTVRLGRIRLRAILDSAYGLDPNDRSEATDAKRQLGSYGELNGLTFYAQVETKPGGNGYGPRNVVEFIVTPDLPDYPTQPTQQAIVPFKRTLEQELDDEIPFN
jgi:hypothetical protein